MARCARARRARPWAQAARSGRDSLGAARRRGPKSARGIRLRAALKHGNSDLIRLSDELEFISAYLELEKMRLGSRLEIRWEIAPGTEELLVPQLILQPLVENAIRHGIACCRAGGWLEIATHRVNGTIELMVRNSVGGTPRSGIGKETNSMP